jgi:hypothetical protein
MNWIETKNETPIIGDPVLVLLEGETLLRGKLNYNGWAAFFADGERLVGTREVTHWMPLPPLPEQKLGDPISGVSLSKRELIAAMIDISKDVEGKSTASIEALMGETIPNGRIENYKYWARVEAKMRVIKADALLNELSKPQP